MTEPFNDNARVKISLPSILDTLTIALECSGKIDYDMRLTKELTQ